MKSETPRLHTVSRQRLGFVLIAAAFATLFSVTTSAENPRYRQLPKHFYRANLARYQDLKPDGKGKAMVNLFDNMQAARDWLSVHGDIWDPTVYEIARADLEKTPDGLAFLEQALKAREAGRDSGAHDTLEISSPESYEQTVIRNAKPIFFRNAEGEIVDTVSNDWPGRPPDPDTPGGGSGEPERSADDPDRPGGGSDDPNRTGGGTDDPDRGGGGPDRPGGGPSGPDDPRPSGGPGGPDSPPGGGGGPDGPGGPGGSRSGDVGTGAAGEVQFSDPSTQTLYELIRDKPAGSMDLDFYKDVYGRPDAKKKVKMLFARFTDGIWAEKSRRLANLRKWDADYKQAKFARDNHVRVQNTNQGKTNAARSDLDRSVNILEFDSKTGKFTLKDGAVSKLIVYLDDRYQDDGLIDAKNVDVTFFNGDSWLPDWRDHRMSWDEFRHKTYKGVYDLRSAKRPGSFVPGAYKEQTHDRALAEGRSVHIAWDYFNLRPTINDRPVEFDVERGEVVDAETREPVREWNTREMAQRGTVLRRGGQEVLEPRDRWRRAFGNLVQNMGEFLAEEEPVSRNKLFIERIIDGSVGRFTHVYRLSYADVHGSALADNRKTSWKGAFIQQAFGLPDGSARIDEIQSVLDRSAEIQLDKTGRWHDDHTASYDDRARDYYAQEWADARDNVRAELEANGRQPGQDFERLTATEAERLFVEKQRNLILEGATRVVEETFRRNFTAEGARYNRHRFGAAGAAKILLEGGVELALFMDSIETAPGLTDAQRTELRRRIIQSIPAEARPLARRLTELSRLKLNLMGRGSPTPWIGGDDVRLQPSELMARAKNDIRRLLGNVDLEPPVQNDVVRQAMFDMILQHLGPVDAPKFQRAWKEGNAVLTAKFTGKAYWQGIKNQVDFLMVTGAAVGMLDAYQRHCALQLTWNQDCLSGLGWQAGHETMMMLPGINSGLLTVIGLRDIRKGNYWGFVPFTFGLASLPPVASRLGATSAGVIQLYVAINLTKLGYDVTIGYTLHRMADDAVEQALKAHPEPGKQARRFRYPNEPTVKADTPTFPLLSDIIPVEADGWDAAKRFRVAAEMFANGIESELKELGYKWYTEAGKSKKREIIARYADELPYVQRTRKIYETFHPRMRRTEHAEILDVCLDVKRASIEKKYQEPPGYWDWLRYWYDETQKKEDKKKELNQVMAKCLAKAAEEESPTLWPVFRGYVSDWFSRQSDGYRSQYDREHYREAFTSALINHYLVQRRLDLNETARDRQLEKGAERAQRGGDARRKVFGHLLAAQQKAQEELTDKVGKAGEDTYKGEPPSLRELQPEERFHLQAPEYALRWGRDTAYIDIEARGEYFQADESKNVWNPVLSANITSVSLEQPPNLVMTKALEEELRQVPGGPRKQMVHIIEELTAELQYGGAVQATATPAVIDYFDVLPWGGRVAVEVRAAGESTEDMSDPTQTYAYAGATLRLSGAADAQQLSEWWDMDFSHAGARFENLPAGGFSIQVEPRQDDPYHSGAGGAATLVDFTPSLGWVPDPSNEDDQVFEVLAQRFPSSEEKLALVRWKDSERLTVVLPYVPPTEEEEPEEPDEPEEMVSGEVPPDDPGQPGSGETEPEDTGGGQTVPPGGGGTGGGQPDPEVIQECNDLIAQAQALAAAGDLLGASEMLQQLQQGCAGLDPGIDSGLDDLVDRITQGAAQALVTDIGLQQQACEYEGALKPARELQQIDPHHAWLAANLATLERMAEAQRQARILLRDGQAAIERKDFDTAIASFRWSLAVPDLPPCMRDSITDLLIKIESHKRFIDLTEMVENATTACNYSEAERLINEISGITPREQFMTAWLDPAVTRMADLKDREAKALSHIANADALGQQAAAAAGVDPPDWDQITPLLTQAATALADAENIAPACVRDREKPRIDAIRRSLLDIQRRKESPIQTSIVLLIDTSGSMRNNDKIEQAKRAARASVGKVSQTTEMAVLNFDGSCSPSAVKVAHPFSTNAASLMDAINRLGPGGGTPMYIATAEAIKFTAKNGRGKQGLVVLMSDGADSCNDDQKREAADTITPSQIPVNTIGFDVGTNADARRDLEELAKISRGRSYSAGAADPKEIIRAFNLALLPSLLKAHPDVSTSGSSGPALRQHFDRAQALVKRQDVTGALNEFEQAHKVAPDSPAVNYNLSLLNEAEDRLIAANRHAREYLRLAPGALDRADVEARIANLEEELRRNPRAEFDPSVCRDIYVWARTEQRAAKRAKDVNRRQAIMETMIAAQKGDCEEAAKLADQYKQRYQ